MARSSIRYSRARISATRKRRLWGGHGRTGAELVRNIPRLESVAANIAAQHEPFIRAERPGEPPLGARVLRVVTDYDTLTATGRSVTEAMGELRARKRVYDPEILDLLQSVVDADFDGRKISEISLRELTLGMVLEEPVESKDGLLIVAKGRRSRRRCWFVCEVLPAFRTCASRSQYSKLLLLRVRRQRRAAPSTLTWRSPPPAPPHWFWRRGVTSATKGLVTNALMRPASRRGNAANPER